MRPLTMLVTIAALSVPAVSASAADQRFQIEKTKYGFVRMDTATGAMTFCREDDEQLVCTPAASETSAVEDKVGETVDRLAAIETRLNTAEAALKAAEARAKTAEERLKAAEAALKDGTAKLSALEAAQNQPRSITSTLPSDAEVDQVFTFMEKMMRRFMEMDHDLDRQPGNPQKT